MYQSNKPKWNLMINQREVEVAIEAIKAIKGEVVGEATSNSLIRAITTTIRIISKTQEDEVEEAASNKINRTNSNLEGTVVIKVIKETNIKMMGKIALTQVNLRIFTELYKYSNSILVITEAKSHLTHSISSRTNKTSTRLMIKHRTWPILNKWIALEILI